MTIGEGIFWSTVLVIVFTSIILITKYNRWKAFSKGLGIVLALTGLVSAGTWFYFEYQSRPQVATSLSGITLGMSELDVTLAKGAPDEVSELDPISDGFRKYLLYKGSYDSYTYAILRGSKDKLFVTDICDNGGYGKVLGFGEYSSESDIISKLGTPSNVSVNQQGTEKLLSFPQWNAAFEIEKSHAKKVCVTSRPQMNYSVEYPGSRLKSEGEQ